MAALAPGTRISHYRLETQLGEGGMGVVWRAVDERLGRPVAIKFLPGEAPEDPAAQARFLEEARLASSLSDTRIAQVYDVGHSDGRPFIVMELVEGQSLDRILLKGSLSWERVVSLGLQVAQALARAHRRGLVHRDVKPANVIVGADGEAKLIDFGLAALTRNVGEPEAEDLRRGATTRLPAAANLPPGGTLAYMPPEQIRGEAVDARSDVYALGVMLYELVCGERPYAGETNWELVEAILKGRANPPHVRRPKVPLELERITLKAMAARREDRYQTTDDLVVDLRKLERELETDSAASYADLGARLDRRRRSRRWLAGVGVAGAVVALALAGGWWVRARTGSLNPKTVLIVPFEVEGQEGKAAAFVGRAFAEGIAVNLTVARDLQVLPVLEPHGKGSAEALSRARVLRAGKLVEGRLVRGGDSTEVTVRLLDCQKGTIAWGEVRRVDDRQISSQAASVASEIVREMQAKVGSVYESLRDLRGSPRLASSPLFVKAKGALANAPLDEAVEAGRALVEAFPREIEARAIYGLNLLDRAGFRPTRDNVSEFLRNLDELQALDPSAPYADYLRAAWARQPGPMHDSNRADSIFAGLLARDDLTTGFRSAVLNQRSAVAIATNPQRGLQYAKEALKLNPLSARALESASLGYVSCGMLVEGISVAEMAVALQPADIYSVHRLALAYMAAGRYEDALAPMRRATDLSRAQSQAGDYAVALLLAHRPAEARRAVAHAESLAPSPWGEHNIASYWSLAGERGRAIKALRKCLDLGYADRELITDPNFKPLANDRDFKAIVEEVERRTGAAGR